MPVVPDPRIEALAGHIPGNDPVLPVPARGYYRLRLQKAQELLTDTDLPLETITQQVGLSSASALVRAVKRHFPMTPRRLAQAAREQREQR